MGPKPINRIGQKFGRLTVLAYAGHKTWRCQCVCGIVNDIDVQNLKPGQRDTPSCGCHTRERCAAKARHAGEAHRIKNLESRSAATRTCKSGHMIQPMDEFLIRRGRKMTRSCEACRKEYKAFNARRQGQRDRWALRLDRINHYGGACQCCGECNPYVLQLDHLNGGGTAERNQHQPKAGVRVDAKVKRLGYPDIYRILCANGNTSFGHYKCCPHDHINHPLLPEKPWQGVTWKLKLKTFANDGFFCQCCQEAFPEFLPIDHVQGGGRKNLTILGQQWYRLLAKRKYPQKRYRLLCRNCNSARGLFGLCPQTGELKQLSLL